MSFQKSSAAMGFINSCIFLIYLVHLQLSEKEDVQAGQGMKCSSPELCQRISLQGGAVPTQDSRTCTASLQRCSSTLTVTLTLSNFWYSPGGSCSDSC